MISTAADINQPPQLRRTYHVAVAGNPNCGKTTVFNALTGLRHKVGNYSGVTVEKRDGAMIADPSIRLLDLPGTYSLTAQSPDEVVASDVLLGCMSDAPRPDAVLIVVDAGNLERNLYLATQIIDLGLPTVVACNMMDVVRQAGHRLDVAGLSQELGVPVVPTVSSRGEGLAELQGVIQGLCRRGTPMLADAPPTLRQRPADLNGDDAARKLTINRYARITRVVGACLDRADRDATTATDRIDRVLAHKFWGLLIFAPAMGLLFFSIFVISSPFMALIEDVFAALRGLLIGAMPAGLLRDLLVNGMLAGVGNVLVFFPQICILFLFIALLEDSGYMARAAFLMNRIMSRVGLHGKSFIPLLSSHACAVPGIMATRTIENPRDRLVTILVAPLMGCSARLTVYTLLIAACLPGSAWVKAVVLLTMYGLGVLTALTMAMIFKRTLLRGPVPAFFIELPPYRWPQLGNVLTVMWDRSRLFLTQAGTIILSMTIVFWALMNFPRDSARAARFEAQRTAIKANTQAVKQLNQREAAERLEYSIVGRLGHIIAPVLRPLGYDWKIGVGIIASIAAREVFVSTMGVVYSVGDDDEHARTLRQELADARWPDGKRVLTPLVAVGLMVFYVLACQCVGTLAVVRRETACWRWPAFMFAYMSILAYAAALLVYQVGSALGLDGS